MSEREINVDNLPAGYREGFAEFAQTMIELAGDDLLGVAAFGGWLSGDAFHNDAPALSVVILSKVDLAVLDQLALQGARLGKRNIRAPLIMTPQYIEASGDVFPLELLEIQQTQRVVLGQDFFAEIKLTPAEIRLQCERELKGALIQLRQQLLAAAGKHGRLAEICAAASERILRTLRGLLHVRGVEPESQKAPDITKAAAGSAGLPLHALTRFISTPGPVDRAEFGQFYADVDGLAQYADTLTTS